MNIANASEEKSSPCRVPIPTSGFWSLRSGPRAKSPQQFPINVKAPQSRPEDPLVHRGKAFEEMMKVRAQFRKTKRERMRGAERKRLAKVLAAIIELRIRQMAAK